MIRVKGKQIRMGQQAGAFMVKKRRAKFTKLFDTLRSVKSGQAFV